MSMEARLMLMIAKHVIDCIDHQLALFFLYKL